MKADNTIKVMENRLTNDSGVKNKNVECKKLGNKIKHESVYGVGAVLHTHTHTHTHKT